MLLSLVAYKEQSLAKSLVIPKTAPASSWTARAIHMIARNAAIVVRYSVHLFVGTGMQSPLGKKSDV
jgi:hypothetical protein